METIKNYLETMFANMPNTSEVVKAKAELLQMMEDKYNELINEGVSENTAVGTVISEFGNLDELADELGLTKEIKQPKANDDFSGRYLGMDEVKEFLSAQRQESCSSLVGNHAAGKLCCMADTYKFRCRGGFNVSYYCSRRWTGRVQ